MNKCVCDEFAPLCYLDAAEEVVWSIRINDHAVSAQPEFKGVLSVVPEAVFISLEKLQALMDTRTSILVTPARAFP